VAKPVIKAAVFNGPDILIAPAAVRKVGGARNSVRRGNLLVRGW